jgi:hypothetical protein
MAINTHGVVFTSRLPRFDLELREALRTGRLATVRQLLAQRPTLRSGAIADALLGAGHAVLALGLVWEERAKFSLAVKVGNLEEAETMALRLGDKEIWGKLGEAALLLGNVEVAEMALQNSDNLARLSFLYVVTGQLDKLQTMTRVKGVVKDVGMQFVNGACCGSVVQQAEALRTRGLKRLAVHTLRTHGLGSVEGAADNLGQPMLRQNVMPGSGEERERKAAREMELSYAAGYALFPASSAFPSSYHIARPYTRFSRPQLLLPPLLLSADAGNWPLVRIAQTPLARPPSELLGTGSSLLLDADRSAGTRVGTQLVKRKAPEKYD